MRQSTVQDIQVYSSTHCYDCWSLRVVSVYCFGRSVCGGGVFFHVQTGFFPPSTDLLIGFVVMLLLVSCSTSQQQASISQGRICSDSCTCCHTKIEAACQTFYLTQSQYTDTGPISPSAEPVTPGAWHGSHWIAIFKSLVWVDPDKFRRKRDSNPGSSALEADTLTTRPTRRLLVVRRPPGERETWLWSPFFPVGVLPRLSPASDLTIGAPVATLPGAWRYRVSAGTGRPGVSILWLGEMESLICNFYLSVAARTIVGADSGVVPFLTLLCGERFSLAGCR